MKLISLNIWGGRRLNDLLDFVKDHSDSDVFCLQELYHDENDDRIWNGGVTNVTNRIHNLLPEHNLYFSAAEDAVDDLEPRGVKAKWGLGMFVHKNLKVDEHFEDFVHGSKNTLKNNDSHTLGRNIHAVKIGEGSDTLHIINVHGLWNGKGKSDTEERIAQSEKIKQFVTKFKGKKLLCGDFNLLPETESLKMLEDGMKNLIREYNITSTRTDLYTKPLKYADYIFVTPEIKVTSLEVPNIPVSDHRPLIVNFE